MQCVLFVNDQSLWPEISWQESSIHTKSRQIMLIYTGVLALGSCQKKKTELARGSCGASAPALGCMLICLEIFIYAHIGCALDEQLYLGCTYMIFFPAFNAISAHYRVMNMQMLNKA